MRVSYYEIETLEMYVCVCVRADFSLLIPTRMEFFILEVILLSSIQDEWKRKMMPVQQYVRHKSTQITKHLESILVERKKKRNRIE